MYRQQSSRNHRSKGGIKLKNVFQVCIMLVIGMWLLYQIKHSHDKKKEFEEQDPDASYKLEHHRLSEIRRASRKDLSDTVVRDFDSKTQVEDEEKEEAEAQEKVKKQLKKEQVAHKESKKVPAEEEASHEAQEKRFKGDDASSAVQHLAQVVPEHKEGSREFGEAEHNTQEVEHEEGSHEAREKSFKGDDVSSAVAHKPVKDSELDDEEASDLAEKIFENEDRDDGKTENLISEVIRNSEGNNEELDAIDQLDSLVDSNSTFINGETETLLKDEDSAKESSAKKKEPEVAITEAHNNQSSSSTTDESGDLIKEQVDQKRLSIVDDQKGLQAYTKNDTSGNGTLLHTSSSILMENQENAPTNSTTRLKEKRETSNNEKKSVDSTTNVASEQNHTTGINPSQELQSEVKIESPHNDKSSIQQIITEKKQNSETTVSQEKPEENNSSSARTTNDTVKEVLVELNSANNSLHNNSAGKETHEHSESSNSGGIQNEVKSGQGGAAQ